MVLSADSKVGVFTPFKHLYIILTLQNKSSSTFSFFFFFFLLSKFPGDVCFNEDPMLQVLTLILRKAPAASEALSPDVDTNKQVPV